jgi:hypothetical protein
MSAHLRELLKPTNKSNRIKIEIIHYFANISKVVEHWFSPYIVSFLNVEKLGSDFMYNIYVQI